MRSTFRRFYCSPHHPSLSWDSTCYINWLLNENQHSCSYRPLSLFFLFLPNPVTNLFYCGLDKGYCEPLPHTVRQIFDWKILRFARLGCCLPQHIIVFLNCLSLLNCCIFQIFLLGLHFHFVSRMLFFTPSNSFPVSYIELLNFHSFSASDIEIL